MTALHKNLLLVCLLVFAFDSSFAFARPRKNQKRSRSVTSEGGQQSSESSYLQRILNIENRRISKDKFLVACLSHHSRRVVKAALIALGRIGDTSALDEMARFLSKRDVEFAETAAFALSIVGGDTAPKILTQSLVLQKDPNIRAAILLGVGRTGLESGMPVLAQALLTESAPQILDAAAEGVAQAWSGPSEQWVLPEGLMPTLAKLTIGPEHIAVSAAAALSRFKGDPKLLPIKEIYDGFLKVQSPHARALLLRTLGKSKSNAVSALMVDRLLKDNHLGARIEAANALKSQTITPATLEAFKRTLTLDSNRGLMVAVLGTISRYGVGANPLTETLEVLAMNHSSTWVRANALKTLSRVSPDKARALAAEWMKDLLHPLYSSAVASHVIFGTGEDIEKVASFLPEASAKVVVEALEEMNAVSEDKFTAAAKLALKRLPLRNDVGITSSVAQLAQQFKWKDFSTLLVSSYPLFTQEDHLEAKLSILNALAVIGDETHFPFLENVTNEKEKLVVVAAVGALKALGGKDLTAKIPLNSTVTGLVPNWQEAKKAVQSEVTLKTTRGDITFRFMEDTPATAYHFVQFARAGFYNGKSFHRVVPNFVAQGGDPRGDGFGGPGFLIRDEVSALKHWRGTVGIATAGRDTGGCQFFINHAPNLHLAGKYTLFGEVIAGMDVVDKLEVGDKILSSKVK